MDTNIAEKGAVFRAKTAVILSAVFLIVFAVCAVLVAVDRAQRGKLEQISVLPAVGDLVVPREKKK